MIFENRRLYFITDRELSRHGLLKDTESVLRAGCKIVQYRETELPRKKMVEEAMKIKALCRKHGAVFIVNNFADIAAEVGADGVHLGQCDTGLAEAKKIMPGKIFGVTVHNAAEAIEAERGGATYISASAIFHTDTKKDAGTPAGIGLIKELKGAVRLPVVAVGGINRGNLKEVLGAGADAVAIISAILKAEDVEMAAREIIKEIEARGVAR